MMRHYIIISLLVILTACGYSPKTSFYTLNGEYADEKDTVETAESVSVGVWQVKLPELLDRKELVVRDSQYEIKIADFSAWGGDLKSNLTQVIIDELSQRLLSSQVVMSPWSRHRKNNYQIKVFVDRFDGTLGGEVVFKGSWSLLNAEGDAELTRKVFKYKTTAVDKSYKEMVAALSKLTVELAEDISKVIKSKQGS